MRSFIFICIDIDLIGGLGDVQVKTRFNFVMTKTLFTNTHFDFLCLKSLFLNDKKKF